MKERTNTTGTVPDMGFKRARGGGMAHQATRMIEKPKDFKGTFKILTNNLKPFAKKIILVLIFACISSLLIISFPSILMKINEQVLKGVKTGTFNFAKIALIGAFLAFVYVIAYSLHYFQAFVMAGVTANVSRDFRNQISVKINKLPFKYYDKESYGNVLSRVTNDVDTISQTLNQSLSSIITSLVKVVGILTIMLLLSPKLTVIVIVSVPVSLILVSLVVKISQKYFVKQQSSIGAINGHIEEIYSGHNVVKVFNAEETVLSKFDKINKELYTSAYKSQFFSGLMMPIMNFVGNIIYLLVCVIGGGMAIKSGNIEFIAVVVAFATYVRSFNQPISQIASITGVFQSTVAAAERVFEFLDEEEQEDESHKKKKIKKVRGEVEFKNVRFAYDEQEVIRGFSCKVKPGQKVAIVGPTGAGKTTLVNLLMRFYDIQSGDILIDGVSIYDMNRSYVRSLFGMVIQETWLFEGTIRENLSFGKKKISEKTLKTACKSANIEHFIKVLPNGLDMVLNEDSGLSQGQKQLFTIARAMVQNAPMLILDEATSSVDTRTENLIQDAMDKLMKGRTSFVIAHRLSTIKNADIILVVDEGNIIEMGTHNELMQTGGFYNKLYNSQFTRKYSMDTDETPAVEVPVGHVQTI